VIGSTCASAVEAAHSLDTSRGRVRKASDNVVVRLIRRKQTGERPLAEGDCYEHAYGENVLGNVDILPREPLEEPAEMEADAAQPLTTDLLKRQFEERLAARTRRSTKRGS
jgi:hypothetical protein